MKMKKIIITLFAALSLFGFSNTSNAQTKSFDGPYVGISIGKTYGDVRHSGSTYYSSYSENLYDVVGETKDLDQSTRSIRAGYLSRMSGSNTVLGIELAHNRLNTSINYAADLNHDITTYGSIDGTVKLHNYTTLAVRLGQALNDKTLISVSAGPAITKISQSHVRNSYRDDFISNEVESNKTGYVLGLGAEYKLTPQLSVRADYEYLNFGKASIATINDDGGVLNDNTKVKFGNASIGLVYSF
jgi:opacity protein-like surface antigen